MNLLTDPLFRVITKSGRETMSLPGLLNALGQDGVEGLSGIQRHQQDAFHVFLCYLAAAVLVRAGESNTCQSDKFWENGLRKLSQAGDDAWTLVVADLSRPAFMQAPLPNVDRHRLAEAGETPDSIDLLPTPKNHDVKQQRAGRAPLDEWIYALISLQTMSGFFGKGNYGISRMNGGFGSRPIVELTNSLRMGARWQAAVSRLLSYRGTVLSGPWGYDPYGMVLVWEVPWDGATALPLQKLDPFYIEICRRIRLLKGESHLEARKVLSNRARIWADELRGVMGDPWIPVDERGRGGDDSVKALTVSGKGFTADLLRQLIFSDGFRMSPLQDPLAEWSGDVWLTASVLIRGQGTTDGFHERTLLVPAKVRAKLFEQRERRTALAGLAQGAVEFAGKMQYQVLRRALRSYLQAGEGVGVGLDADEAWITHAQERFEHLWSDELFPWLWQHGDDADPHQLETEWCPRLRDHARTVLDVATSTLPTHTGRRYHARVAADTRFWWSLYWKDNFPFLKEGLPRGDAISG